MGVIVHHKSHAYPEWRKFDLWKKFINWCIKQEENKLGWLAAAFLVHGCIFVPMTIVSIAMSGNNFIFIAIALGTMIVAVTVTLATLSTKITLPVFFLTLIVDLIIIVGCLFHGLN